MWQLLIPIGLALGGGIYFAGKPISDAGWQRIYYRQYQRHLTPAEVAAAQRGEVVEKIHKKYGDIWHSYFDQGPLRVRWQNGRYQFTPHSTWVRLSKHGQLQAENIYTTTADSVPYKGIWKNYRPDGSLEFVNYQLPAMFDGDSVTHNVVVQFGYQTPADTLSVHHMYSRSGGRAVREFWSRDVRGQQPMPEGWKP
ncbi:hypothetical protein [Hymenobacter psychrophilus]|uniref:Uncharacterized protein n=1 Tax=Hymenobacter psychrophilus TaxID=651662 RepID=A0A1H3DG62_9BACT|nr:hypothetical protein [Hymenobacter psychrophilus]SDX65118.1 hypothetical protein SAMN04488069_102340 [Hymenobacter psychrophilus]